MGRSSTVLWLVYRPLYVGSQLKWVDRSGRDVEVIGKPDSFLSPFASRRTAPGWRRRSTTCTKGGTDIWVYDLVHHAETRLTRLRFIKAVETPQKLHWTRLSG